MLKTYFSEILCMCMYVLYMYTCAEFWVHTYTHIRGKRLFICDTQELTGIDIMIVSHVHRHVSYLCLQFQPEFRIVEVRNGEGRRNKERGNKMY